MPLLPHHLKQLAESGMDEDEANRRGYYSITQPEKVAALGVTKAGCRTPGLYVPFRRVDGTIIGCQYKPDSPREDQSEDGTKFKPIKYETPYRQENCAHVPTGVTAEMLTDVDTPLWITEGAKKADCAAIRGLCIISFSGVWNWFTKGSKGERRLIAILDQIPWNGRKVVLAFDGDVARKVSVQKALDRLSAVLEDRGAKVEYCHLPDTDEKTGLDDYLVGQEHSVEELKGLVSEELPGVNRLGRLKVTPLSGVKFESVRWIMPEWIPFGSLTLLAGREGLGKSTVAARIAADITNGVLEGELFGKPRAIAYIHTEDPRAMVVGPRLAGAGANPERTLFLDATSDDGEHTYGLKFPDQIELLERAVVAYDIALVILDAAKSNMEGSTNDEQEVRKYLEPLAKMAERQGVAVLGIVHFGKRDSRDTGKLITGSLAWSQVARSVLAMARDDDTGEMVITNEKGNYKTRDLSRAVTIASTLIATTDGGTGEIGVCEWGGETDRHARDMLGESTDGKKAGKSKTWQCEKWLHKLLYRHGPMSRSEIFEMAKPLDFSESTIKRAADDLNIIKDRSGFGKEGGAIWSLPPYAKENTDTIRSHSGHAQEFEPTGSDRGVYHSGHDLNGEPNSGEGLRPLGSNVTTDLSRVEPTGPDLGKEGKNNNNLDHSGQKPKCDPNGAEWVINVPAPAAMTVSVEEFMALTLQFDRDRLNALPSPTPWWEEEHHEQCKCEGCSYETHL